MTSSICGSQGNLHRAMTSDLLKEEEDCAKHIHVHKTRSCLLSWTYVCFPLFLFRTLLLNLVNCQHKMLFHTYFTLWIPYLLALKLSTDGLWELYASCKNTSSEMYQWWERGGGIMVFMQLNTFMWTIFVISTSIIKNSVHN